MRVLFHNQFDALKIYFEIYDIQISYLLKFFIPPGSHFVVGISHRINIEPSYFNFSFETSFIWTYWLRYMCISLIKMAAVTVPLDVVKLATFSN